MSLQPDLRRKLSRTLTPDVLAELQAELTANALQELAARDMPPGGLEALAAEIVLRLKGIDYVITELAAVGIEPVRAEPTLFEGGTDRIAAGRNGAQQAT